eukprot:jgi/Tetstr1/432425/TSEL_000188.t1
MLQGPADPAPKTGHKSEPPMVISEAAPRLVIFPGFLSSAERKHLMQLAQEAGLERSGVMDGEEDTARQDVRTSSGAWLEDLLDDGVFDIDLRIQAATGVPWMFGENMHVLRYQPGQKYEAHLDSCFMQDFPRDAVPDASDPQATGDGAFSAGCEAFLRQAGGPDCGPGGAGGPTCGDRVATFLMYLKEPEAGGETAFPRSAATAAATTAAMSQGISLPYGSHIEGFAELIHAVVDLTALHASCPVLAGEKWVATKWMRSSLYKPLFYLTDDKADSEQSGG